MRPCICSSLHCFPLFVIILCCSVVSNGVLRLKDPRKWLLRDYPSSLFKCHPHTCFFWNSPSTKTNVWKGKSEFMFVHAYILFQAAGHSKASPKQMKSFWILAILCFDRFKLILIDSFKNQAIKRLFEDQLVPTFYWLINAICSK